MILFPALLLQAATTPAGQMPRPPRIDVQNGQGITVTGRSLRATGDALKRCLARQCPPGEDIAASLEHANNQLLAGDIGGARDTLRFSRGRNKRHARELPVPVGELLYLDADVASLLGLAEYGRIGAIDSLTALRAGLPPGDERIQARRLLLADVMLREERYRTALDMYDSVARHAASSGWRALQAEAMFRALSIYAAAASVNAAFGAEAERRYAELRATTAPEMRSMRDASVMLEARLALARNREADAGAVLKRFSGTRTSTPLLVVWPEVDLGTATATPGIARDQWIDLTFRVAPDGTVADVETVGHGARAQGAWIGRVEQSVALRRYLPLDVPAGSPGLWRRERMMVVADLTAPIGSRIRTQSGPPKLRVFDLTRDAEPAPGAVVPAARAISPGS